MTSMEGEAVELGIIWVAARGEGYTDLELSCTCLATIDAENGQLLDRIACCDAHEALFKAFPAVA
jgi:hypothetical protein